MKIIENEMNYQILLSLIRNLYNCALIDDEEFERANCILLEKYKPYISELFYCNHLTN